MTTLLAWACLAVLADPSGIESAPAPIPGPASMGVSFVESVPDSSAVPTLVPPSVTITIPDSIPTPHPRLLLTGEEIRSLEQKVRRPIWSERWERYRRQVDALLDERMELPPRGGAWMHIYACPDHALELRRGKKIGDWRWEHICDAGPHLLRGDPTDPRRDYDACVMAQVHMDLAYLVRDAGVLYQVTGESRYAREGRRILAAYAERYRSYPLHGKPPDETADRGRVQSQSLDEAAWLIPICQGADLLWPAMPEEERAALRRGLLSPAARETILPRAVGIHNTQCWRNSAVGLVGFLTGEVDLIDAAIRDERSGYLKQMAEGVLASGMWREGSWAYHAYMLRGTWPLVEAARNCGIDLAGESLRSAFRAPVRFAMPDGTLPGFNDGGSVPPSAPLYEIAYARLGDPQLLKRIDRIDRSSRYSLWFGVDDLPEPPVEPAECLNDPAGGYAILRDGADSSGNWICLKYGPHGGGHGHPDKASCILYSGGEVLMPDPGGGTYGPALHADWYRTTLAHNTLVVDERNQSPATGRCLAFGCDAGVRFAIIDAGPIYDGVRFERAVVLPADDLILFADRVVADRRRTLDLACHIGTAWEDGRREGPPPPLRQPGYRNLRDVSAWHTEEAAAFRFARADGGSVLLCLAGGERTRVIAGMGPGAAPDAQRPVVVFRRAAASTTFLWCVSTDGAAASLDPPSIDAGGLVTTTLSSAGRRWRVEVDFQQPRIRMSAKE